MRQIIKIRILTTVVGIGLVFGAVQTIAAQSPTPSPASQNVEIVRLADDLDVSNAIILSPQEGMQNTTVETKIDSLTDRIKELTTRLNSLETTKTATYDAKQRQLLLNLDILTRSEQRAEALRKQLYEIIEKENQLTARIGQIDVEMRPEFIDRSVSLAGSLRPEDLRDIRRKSLAAEKTSVESMLVEVQSRKLNLQQSVDKADALVDKLRFKLEKEIDDALRDNEEEN